MRQHSVNLSQPFIGPVVGSKTYSLPSKRKKQPKRLAETKTMSQAEWLKVRKQGIGSSDCAAACGLNPYMSMLELWMIKTGRIQQNIEDESEGHAPLFKGLVCQSFYRIIYGFAYMRYFVYKGVIKSQKSLIR